MTGEVIFNGRLYFTHGWCLSDLLLLTPEARPADGSAGRSLVPSLQAERRDGVCSRLARSSRAGDVHTWELSRGHLITGAACSYQVLQEKHCLVLHTKCDHWRPFIFWEEICVGCLWVESSPRSWQWVSKLLTKELDRETDLSSFPKTSRGGHMVMVRFLRLFFFF